MKSLRHIGSLGLVTFLLTGCSGTNDTESVVNGVFTNEIRKFSSCQNLRETTKVANSILSQIYPTFDDAVPVTAPTNESNTIYDTQSKNISESDRVLINSNRLFILRKSSLEVFNRTTFQKTQTLHLPPAHHSTMFVTDEHVVLINSIDYETTNITVLDSNQLFVKKRYHVDGAFGEARMHNDQLILQTSTYVDVSAKTSRSLNDDEQILSPQCQDIYESQVNAYNSTMTLLYNFSLNDLSKKPSMTGFADYTHLMYMSDNALYLASNSFYTFPSHLRQVKWDADSIKLTSVVNYPGSIKDRWAINEYGDSKGTHLAIATTIWASSMFPTERSSMLLPNTDRTNKILLYSDANKKLKLVAESKPFGNNEDIRSVRFLNDLAYVVTFRTTDPLFIFDLSDRADIRLLGELKVPGFSTHLRPLSDQDLLGVGYDAVIDSYGRARQAGIQVSLFDVSVKEKPSRKNVFTFGVRGSYSDATLDAHALMYDKATGLVALPLVEFVNPSSKDPSLYGTSVAFAGAHVFKYHHGQISTLGRLSHEKWRLQFSCDTQLFNGWGYGSSDINRVITVDGRLITVSQFGVMVHNPQTLDIISEQMFTPRSSGFCYEPGPVW